MNTVVSEVRERLKLHQKPLAIGAVAVAAAAVVIAIGVSGGSSESAKLFRGPDVVAGEDATFWRSGAANIPVATSVGVTGATAVTVTLTGKQSAFTMIKHDFHPATNWSARRWLYVDFRGQATGEAFSLFIDTDPALAHSAQYSFADTSTAWTTLAFDLSQAQRGTPPFDWKHVYTLRIASDLKTTTGTFAVGRVTLSKSATP